MAAKQNRKIVKYKKPIQPNIGIVVFAVIFLYMMYYVFSFFTTKQVSAYEVNQGSIAQNTVLNGLILREETVYYAQTGGYVNYYYKDGTKASVGSFVYSVDETGDFYTKMSAVEGGQLQISDESFRQLEAVAGQYLSNYSDMEFRKVYQFKYDMEATLVEVLNANARGAIDTAAGDVAGMGLHVYPAETAGVVVYHIDGLEDVTVDTFTPEMFDTAQYEKVNLLNRQTVAPGEPVYKAINSELWQVVVPIDEALAFDLQEEENIQVEFKKDKSTAWASSQVIDRDGALYLVLEFNNSMIRFASDRFVELELLLTDTSGLKIPNTAITTKDFLTVPKEYITKGGNSDNSGLLVQRTNEKGETKTEFAPITLFLETEDSYYIDGEGIGLGDVVIKPDSAERYTLNNLETLEGVYNINKGYAVFKRIEKLFGNEEYTIIASGTAYGISVYDHIALDSSAVAENDILH